jgi:hypothetical protein
MVLGIRRLGMTPPVIPSEARDLGVAGLRFLAFGSE